MAPVASQIYRCFKKHDLMTCESKVHVAVSLARELGSFVRPRELVSFDPRQMTCSPPNGKRVLVGKYNNITCTPCVIR